MACQSPFPFAGSGPAPGRVEVWLNAFHLCGISIKNSSAENKPPILALW